ncbi:hypothetical protein DPEC_G00326860 [Dallia pectoralis]|uniref:Uncharacterized protein n=1 Tax=Dallia pectoralis TaxID=75939 RepID=A0ACC2F7W8_DALPE|nr:hypothetical protein DPEC_G00326860 [Dallia pectoralis]
MPAPASSRSSTSNPSEGHGAGHPVVSGNSAGPYGAPGNAIRHSREKNHLRQRGLSLQQERSGTFTTGGKRLVPVTRAQTAYCRRDHNASFSMAVEQQMNNVAISVRHRGDLWCTALLSGHSRRPWSRNPARQHRATSGPLALAPALPSGRPSPRQLEAFRCPRSRATVTTPAVTHLPSLGFSATLERPELEERQERAASEHGS